MQLKIRLQLIPMPCSRDGSNDRPPTQREWFRQHARDFSNRHWMLDHQYGRTLLIDSLRRIHPEFLVSPQNFPSGLEPWLEALINEAGLRNWERPRGLLRQIAFAFRLASALTTFIEAQERHP